MYAAAAESTWDQIPLRGATVVISLHTVLGSVSADCTVRNGHGVGISLRRLHSEERSRCLGQSPQTARKVRNVYGVGISLRMTAAMRNGHGVGIISADCTVRNGHGVWASLRRLHSEERSRCWDWGLRTATRTVTVLGSVSADCTVRNGHGVWVILRRLHSEERSRCWDQSPHHRRKSSRRLQTSRSHRNRSR
ncbi:hypothetical protein J6590_092693 [Homalodisca vitripennis]|nr:hypothetical protein J6590_092693 [Homalodisca vitripennis]